MDQNKTQTKDQEIQDRLLNAIDMVEKQLDQIKTDNLNNVIMLVGKTGSGKSTIFNFLSGAQFQIVEDQDENQALGLLIESEQFQKMKGGLDSTTKFPKLYYSQQYQHSIIDYPGFNDTEIKDQLEIQLLFNKIVTINQIKFAYVLNNPTDQFQNKAEDLQEFIRETEIDINKLTIIINAYCKNKSDEKLIADFQQQIIKKFEKPAYKMIIQRDADSQEKIEKYFSDECRSKLWINLVGSQEIQMKRYELNAYKDADYYISKKSYEIQKILLEYIDQQKCKQYTSLQLKEFKEKIEELDKLKTILKSFIDGNINVLNQIMKYCDQFSEVEIITTQRIYLFFLDSQTEFRQMNNYIKDVYKNLTLCIEFLNIKLQFLEQLRIAEDKILQIEDEKKNMKKELEIQKENEKKLNEIKLEKQELNHQIQEQLIVNQILKNEQQRLEEKNKQEKEELSKVMKLQEDEYKVEIKKLKDQDFQQQKSIQNANQANEELQKQLNQKSQDLNTRNNELQDVKKQFSNLQNEIKIKIDELKRLESKLKTTEEQNKDQLNKYNSLLEKTKKDQEEYKKMKEQEIEQIKLRSLRIRFQLQENNCIKQENPCYAIAINKDNSMVLASCDNLITVYDLQYGKLNKNKYQINIKIQFIHQIL